MRAEQTVYEQRWRIEQQENMMRAEAKRFWIQQEETTQAAQDAAQQRVLLAEHVAMNEARQVQQAHENEEHRVRTNVEQVYCHLRERYETLVVESNQHVGN